MVDGKATVKQLEYIESLAGKCGASVERPLDELSVEEASVVIDELVRKVYGVEPKGLSGRDRNDFGSGARIGMVFKLCYDRWVRSGRNVFEFRDEFCENVLDTLGLLDFVTEKVLSGAGAGSGGKVDVSGIVSFSDG